VEKEERNRALIRFDNIKEETITNQILLMVTNDFLFQLLYSHNLTITYLLSTALIEELSGKNLFKIAPQSMTC